MKALFGTLALIGLAAISPLAAANSLETRLNTALAKTNPGTTVAHIGDSHAAGIKEIRLSNGEYLYTTADAGYLLSGRLI